MGNYCIRAGGILRSGTYREFICDGASDLAALPGLEKCTPGSRAFVIATGEHHMLSTAGAWTKLPKQNISAEEIADKLPKHIIITLGDDGADGWTITEATAGGQTVALTDAAGAANYAALLAAINTSVSKGGTVELKLGSAYYTGAVSRSASTVCITYLEMSSAPPEWDSSADSLAFGQVLIESSKVSVVWQEV